MSIKHLTSFIILIVLAASFSEKFELPTDGWKVKEQSGFDEDDQFTIVLITQLTILFASPHRICRILESSLYIISVDGAEWSVTFIPEGEYGSNVILGTHYLKISNEKSPLSLLFQAYVNEEESQENRSD